MIARLAGQAQEAAGVDGLAGVLGGVVNDRGQAHGPGDWWVPGVVDDVIERLRREGAQVGGGQGVGVVKVGEEETEVADDDLGGLLGRVVPVLGVVWQGQGEALAVAAGDPDGLDARKRRDLDVELASRVPGQPSQGVDAGRELWGGPGVGLLERDTVEGAVEALAGPGQDVNEHLKSRHKVRLRGGSERIGRTAHRALSRLHQFQWEVSRYDTAPARGMRVTRFTDHLLRIAVSRQCSR